MGSKWLRGGAGTCWRGEGGVSVKETATGGMRQGSTMCWMKSRSLLQNSGPKRGFQGWVLGKPFPSPCFLPAGTKPALYQHGKPLQELVPSLPALGSVPCPCLAPSHACTLLSPEASPSSGPSPRAAGGGAGAEDPEQPAPAPGHLPVPGHQPCRPAQQNLPAPRTQ